MPKGKVVTPEVKAIVRKVYDRYPKWTAKEIRAEVEHLLNEKKRKYPEGWPGLSAVQKELAIIRNPGSINSFPFKFFLSPFQFICS